MNNQPSPQMPTSDEINERIKTAVQSHRIKLRLLNTVACVFGFLALATSVFIVMFYAIKYMPKQRELLQQARAIANSPSNPNAPAMSTEDLLRNEVVLTYVASTGVTIVAVAVGLLGLGTLILLTVVILSRRVALNRINASLGQISKQLQEMQKPSGNPL